MTFLKHLLNTLAYFTTVGLYIQQNPKSGHSEPKKNPNPNQPWNDHHHLIPWCHPQVVTVTTQKKLTTPQKISVKPCQVSLPSKPSKGSKATGAMAPGAMPLTGFDSLKSDVPAAVRAAEEPETRLLRPPHRTHMPNELPAEEWGEEELNFYFCGRIFESPLKWMIGCIRGILFFWGSCWDCFVGF